MYGQLMKTISGRERHLNGRPFYAAAISTISRYSKETEMPDRISFRDGYVPGPGKVQGGYMPATATHAAPPTGGSAVKPPPARPAAVK